MGSNGLLASSVIRASDVHAYVLCGNDAQTVSCQQDISFQIICDHEKDSFE